MEKAICSFINLTNKYRATFEARETQKEQSKVLDFMELKF